MHYIEIGIRISERKLQSHENAVDFSWNGVNENLPRIRDACFFGCDPVKTDSSLDFAVIEIVDK